MLILTGLLGLPRSWVSVTLQPQSDPCCVGLPSDAALRLVVSVLEAEVETQVQAVRCGGRVQAAAPGGCARAAAPWLVEASLFACRAVFSVHICLRD